MWHDPIVEEIHKTREKLLEDHNYDLKKLFEQISAHEQDLKSKGWKLVTKKDIEKDKSNIA